VLIGHSQRAELDSATNFAEKHYSMLQVVILSHTNLLVYFDCLALDSFVRSTLLQKFDQPLHVFSLALFCGFHMVLTSFAFSLFSGYC
jgi:hypothetical protein